ncbi:type II toxin-antitoxin system ParD family antitoxin [Marinomonas sp. BSi20584]|nr:type II toxin-antitoxin system ParD family antitoxin [Marinomonas sp. BSi20584]
MNTLRQRLIEGEEGGIADYDLDSLINELDNEERE